MTEEVIDDVPPAPPEQQGNPATPVNPPVATPTKGGSYTLNPATGALTPITE